MATDISTKSTASSKAVTKDSALSAVNTFKEKAVSFWNGSMRNIVFMTIFATLVAIILVLMLWASGTEYRPLYSKNSNFDSSEVLRLLDAEQIKYELNADSGLIMVPKNDVARIRMTLAAKGLKEQLPSGFDALTENMTVGESQFMENARYKHALEGELARSIVTIDAINAARVHLAIPKESLFKRKDAEKPSASVVTNIINGMTLKPEQVDAIVNIVSGAVIGLKSENVRVVDQYGRLLSSTLNDGDIAYSTNKQADFKENLENRLIEQASDILTPVLGATNFRVQVSSDIDFSKVEETQEIYSDPVVRSETNLSDTKSSGAALGIPGSMSNTPPVTDAPEGEESQPENSRSESSRTYAVGGKVIKTQHQQGSIEKLYVSVVLNQNQENNWSEAQLENVKNIVSTAIGINQARGDVINVSSMPFIAAEGLDVAQFEWYENPSYMAIAKYTFITLISAMLVLLVLRPMAKHIIKMNSPQEEENDSNASGLLDNTTDPQNQVPAFMELPSPDSAIEDQIKHLRLIADKDPERVGEILQSWMKGEQNGTN